MEIARFIFTAVGTFLSVLGFSFAVFQYWRKKQDEKIDLFRKSIESSIQAESANRKDADARLNERVKSLEETMSQRFENRISMIEGELKGIKAILQSIKNWFINNAGGAK
jgi:hypothetical protein